MMRRKLEQKVRDGKFNQIPNIPRVISKLISELQLLQENLDKTKSGLKVQAEKKIARLQWLVKELNKHRESETNPSAAKRPKP